MNSDKRTRLNAVRKIEVPFAATSEALKRLEAFQAGGRRPGDGRVIQLTGPSRSGKSTILNMHAKKSASEAPRPHRVALFTLPTKCTEKAIVTSILEAMGDKGARVNTRVQNVHRIPLVADAMGTEIVMIDEAQHLVNKRNGSINEEAADSIKVLVDFLGVPVVLAGTENLDRLFLANEQLEGRRVARLAIAPFQVDSQDSFDEYRCFLLHYDRKLPFDMTSGLHESHIAKAIHAASMGLIGRTTAFLFLAAEFAIADERPYIEVYHLARAWDEIIAPASHARGLANPFERLREPKHQKKTDLVA